MNKKVLSIALLMSTGLFLTSCEKEKVVPADNLPSEISTYVDTHFPNNRILQVIKDKDGLTTSYEVILDGTITLEFNRNKEIIDIDGIAKLPDSVIPEKIRTYVVANYAGSFITDWELDGRNQQIELSNGLDLEFAMNGDFLRIDS